MWWMMLAQGAMAGGQTALQNRANDKAARAQNRANYAADLETTINLAQAVTAVNVQNAELLTSAARQSNEAEQAAYAAAGTAETNAAAAGVKGASVDAVGLDIQRELEETKVAIEQNLEVQQYNLSNRLAEMRYGASAAMRGTVKAQHSSPLVSGLMAAGGSYMNNYMKFGA